VKYKKIFFIYKTMRRFSIYKRMRRIAFIFFSEARIQVRPVDGFLRVIAQKTCNHARMCLFLVVIKLKFNIKPLFIPKTVKMLTKMDSFLTAYGIPPYKYLFIKM